MSNFKEFSDLVDVVREKSPLVHHITNYVTVNDCANITLAIGASPIMADAVEEAADIASISSSLVINMGTLNERTVASMIAAGKSANEKGIPVIFDPVGAGASKYRNDVTDIILKQVKVAVIRGNISEVKYISGISSNVKGVDACESDEDSDNVQIASELASRFECVVAITGEVDTVSDGDRTVLLGYGHEKLSSITGTGCMCTSLVGAFCGASPDQIFEATGAAVMCMGIAGELAYEQSGKNGNGSFHMSIIDAISKMETKTMSNYVNQK